MLDQFAATNDRDFPRAMIYYADEVELLVDPDAFLQGGTFSGREAVGRWFGDWFATFNNRSVDRNSEPYRTKFLAEAAAQRHFEG